MSPEPDPHDQRRRRLRYLETHARAIGVRGIIRGRYVSTNLAALQTAHPDIYRTWLQRLIIDDAPPHRKLKEGEPRPAEPIEW